MFVVVLEGDLAVDAVTVALMLVTCALETTTATVYSLFHYICS
jgi:hypothetical protein